MFSIFLFFFPSVHCSTLMARRTHISLDKSGSQKKPSRHIPSYPASTHLLFQTIHQTPRRRFPKKKKPPTMSTALSLHQIPFPATSPSPRLQIRRAVPRAAMSDHLQRVGKPQQPPESIRRRSPPMGLWDRFPAARTVQQMMDTMDRIMEDPIEPAPVAGALSGYRRGGRTPWEIREGEGEYKLRFDMPGMEKKDVRVWVEEGMLVFKAEKGGAEEGEGGWPAASFGRYGSRIALPENAEVEKIGAEVRDGVLYVTVPKASPSSKVVDIAVQ